MVDEEACPDPEPRVSEDERREGQLIGSDLANFSSIWVISYNDVLGFQREECTETEAYLCG